MGANCISDESDVNSFTSTLCKNTQISEDCNIVLEEAGNLSIDDTINAVLLNARNMDSNIDCETTLIGNLDSNNEALMYIAGFIADKFKKQKK